MRELPRIGGEVGTYRLEQLVSRGGMAVVYLAEDLRLGRKVALKILALELAEDDRFRTRFLRESRVAASIDHPNVIPIFDAGETDGLLYIAMRHVEDPDLRQLLRAEAPLDIARSVTIGIQVASALGAAHKRDLVHRDVKPANVLLIHRTSPRGADHAYLSDFGIAKHASSVSGLTATGQLVGTVSYVAPEQIEDREIDGRTDIYALGCVLFECLAGRPAFKKQEDVAVLMAHLSEPAPPVTSWRPDCPPELAAIVARTLEKAPGDRFQTCEELVEALRGIDMTLPEMTATRVGLAGEAVGAGEPSAAGEPSVADADPSGYLSRPSVATPTGGGGEPPAGEPSQPAAAPPPARGRPVRLLLAGAAALAAVAVGLVLLLGGGDDDKGATQATVGKPPTTTTGGPPNVAAEWRLVKPPPLARQQVAAAAVGGLVCVAGGLTGTGNTATATNVVQAYDPAINTWITSKSLPQPLHHAMGVSYESQFVVLGGFVPKGPNLTAAVSKKVYVLRPTGWDELPDLHHARAAGAAAVVDGKIVVVGGQAGGELVKETEVFDGKRWRDRKPMPTPREHLAAAATSRFVYAVGGRDLSADKNTGALERYDARNNEWKPLANMPTPSGSFGAGVVNGQLVAVGGESEKGVTDVVQGYNLKTRVWAPLASLPTARHGLGVVGVGATLFAIGGARARGHVESTDEADALDFGDNSGS